VRRPPEWTQRIAPPPSGSEGMIIGRDTAWTAWDGHASGS
jgi:hypothetical protein